MKFYLFDKDVDNYRSCFIKDTSLDKKQLRGFNKGEPINLNGNTIEFYFDLFQLRKSADMRN